MELRVDFSARNGARRAGFWLVRLAGREGSRDPGLDLPHWTLDLLMAVTRVVTSVSKTERCRVVPVIL